MEDKIKEVLDNIRPYLINDGGDIEFVKYENGTCYLHFNGHCANCPMMFVTLDDLIKEALVNEIPEITNVELI